MHDRRGLAAMPVSRLLAALGVVAIAAACSPTAPSPTPTSAATVTTPSPATPTAPVGTLEPLPTTAATQSSGAPPCIPADLKASHGLVEGAAGSAVTEVLLVSGVACSVDAYPTLGLRDADGTALVGGVAGGAGRIDLVAGTPYRSAVRVANWCLPEPAFPVELAIRLGAEELPVTGGSFPEEGNLPPCNGDGPPILEGGAWIDAQP